MNLTFRTRKYGSYIDNSFFVKDGGQIVNMEKYLIGDRVSLMWPATPDKVEAFENLDPRLIGRDFYIVDSHRQQGEKATVATPCVVVQRTHALSRMGDFAEMRDFGLTITLEAINGYVEDMLLWLMLNERPTWAGN